MNLEASSPGDEDRPTSWLRSQWQENHGNWLLAFVTVILLTGVAGLVYQELRFVKPKFPDASVFKDQDREAASSAEAAEGDDRFLIRISGSATMSGSMVIQIFDSADSWGDPSRAIAETTVAIQDGVATGSFRVASLPKSIAVLAFHDEDGDGQLGMNAMGVPAERYGYSGNPRFERPNQPPGYGEAAIDRPPPGSTLDLFIR